MGLDTVELMMRTEEVFAIDLPDEECGQVRTVGDLYRLVLEKLELPYVSGRDIESQIHGSDRSRLKGGNGRLWTSADVWLTLKVVIRNQLQVNMDEVAEQASFQDDLRCD